MGLASRLRSTFFLRASDDSPDPYGGLGSFVEWLGNSSTASGVAMNPRRMMQISSAYSAIRHVTEATASMPLILYRRLPDGGKERAREHPLYHTIKRAPSPTLSSIEWRSLTQRDIETHGNGYALPISVRGRDELHYVAAQRVTPKVDRIGRVRYEVRPREGAGPARILRPDQIVHLRGPFGDDVCASSPAIEFRELFGLAWAIEQFLAYGFRNGVRLSGVISTNNTLSDKAFDHLKQQRKDGWEGVENAGKLLILEEGLKFTAQSQSNRDAQVVELRDKVDAAVARVFAVPLHMINSMIAQPRANMEQQAREFVDHSLRSRLVRWEQKLEATLLPPTEEFFFEHLLDELLRGDAKTRAQVYGTYLDRGVLSPNEVRGRENWNPFDGGDVRRAAMNTEPMLPSDGQPDGEKDEALERELDLAAELLHRRARHVLAAADSRCRAAEAKRQALLELNGSRQ